MRWINHRLSATPRGRYTESPGQRSRQNRLPSHAEIKSRLIELEIKEGRNFNLTAQKSGYPIGYSAPSRDVTTTPPAGGRDEVRALRLETGRDQNLSQSHIKIPGCPMWFCSARLHIDVLTCSICKAAGRGEMTRIRHLCGNRRGQSIFINRNIGGEGMAA